MAVDPKLDIVFFDIDDTLLSTTAFARVARRDAVEAMVGAGLRIGVDEGFTELNEIVAEFSSNYANHFGRLLDRLGPEAYPDRNPAILISVGVVAYHRAKRGLHNRDDARDLLDALRAADVRAGVISAGLNVKQAEKLVRLDVLDYFDPTAIFFTDQMGVSKPNPKLFTKALGLIDVQPERALYIGDRPAHDVAPARSIGMYTVHYTGAGGRHGGEQHEIEAHHTVDDMRDLLPIFRDRYGLPL